MSQKKKQKNKEKFWENFSGQFTDKEFENLILQTMNEIFPATKF